MAGIAEIYAGPEHDLTPEGDASGNPPDGPEKAPELAGEIVSNDPQLIEVLYPNPNEENVVPRIESPRDAEITPLLERRVTTRVLNPVITMAPGDPPMPLLPRDPNRKSLLLRAQSVGDGYGAPAGNNPHIQPWVWSGEKDGCYNGASPAQTLYTVDGPVTIWHHTGAVWVQVPSTATENVRIQAWAITE